MDKNTKLKEEFQLNEPKTVDQAVEILPKISTSKFIGSVDIDITLNIKEKQRKESMKGSVEMPHKFGEKKVIVLCDPKDAEEAKKAGAVDAGLEKLQEKIEKGTIEFDVIIATPSVMPKIVKLGKVLGPKGLMPSPKNGTISADVAKTVKSFIAGKTNFKMQQGQGVVRGKVAKLDMKSEEIQDNITAFVKAVFNESKKFSGNPIKTVLLSPTMGPSIKLDFSGII